MVASLKLLASLALPVQWKDKTFDAARVQNDIYTTVSSDELQAIGSSARGQVWASSHERLQREMQSSPGKRRPIRDSINNIPSELEYLFAIGEDLNAYAQKLHRQRPSPTKQQMEAFKQARRLLQGEVDAAQSRFNTAVLVLAHIGSG